MLCFPGGGVRFPSGLLLLFLGVCEGCPGGGGGGKEMKLCPGGGLMPGGPGGIFFGRPGGGGGGILKLAWGRGAVMDHQKIIALSKLPVWYLVLDERCVIRDSHAKVWPAQICQ